MKKAIEVKNNIFWTGSLDYDIRTFDIIMETEYGTTYNSYVVKGETKTALVEIAKEEFFDEFIERLGGVVDPTKIDYIIVNHTEPDHTGSLARLVDLNPNVELIGSMSAMKFIKEVVNKPLNTRVVKEGDTLDLGGKTFKFIMVPFLHWPDTMWTYDIEDKVIFTCDAFGCHYCSDKIFNDEQSDDFLDAYKYYFDKIMGPFKPSVLAALEKLNDVPLEYVCTGHGPILRKDIPRYTNLYKEWATVEKPASPSVVVAYVSSYGYTKKLALQIAEGLQAGGVTPHVFDLIAYSMEEILAKAEDAAGILVGSPTLVGDTLPPVWAFLSELNPFVHKGKIAGVFGSYGWSGEAVPNIAQRFEQLRFKMPLEPVRVVFNPSNEDLKKAFAFGKEFGELAAKL